MIYHCEHCGKEFKAKPSAHRRFCSWACRDEADKELHFLGKRESNGVTKVCETCGKEFYVIKSRENTAHFCSRECASKSKIAQPNVICSYCGKAFHMKKNQMMRHKRTEGYFCSTDCHSRHMSLWFTGSRNHQFGIKGELNASFKGIERIQKNHKLRDVLVYSPEHPHARVSGRVLKHHLVVEENADLFSQECFVVINGKRYVNTKIYVVHHKDGNHSNNSLSNLEILTRSEHQKLHVRLNPHKKDKTTGRFI